MFKTMITSIWGLTKRLMINNKKRMLFSILGVILSITLLIGMSDIFHKMEQGGIKEIRDQIGETDILIGYQVSDGKYLEKVDIDNINQTNGVVESANILVNPMPRENAINLLEPTDHVLDMYTLGIENNSLPKDYYNINHHLAAHDVILSETLANQLEAKVGDSVEISTPYAPAKSWNVVEIFDMGQTANPIQMAIFHLESLQEWYDLENETNLMLLKTDPNIDKTKLVFSLKNQYQAMDVLSVSGDLIDRNIKSIKIMGQALAIITVFICGFFIFSSFRMFIQENQRELAFIRALGGSRQQCFYIIMIKAILIVGIGTVIGLVLGLLLSNNLSFLISKYFKVELVSDSLPLFSLILYGMASIILILIIVLWPLWKTVNIPPIMAIKNSQQLTFKNNEVRNFLSQALLLLGIILLIVAGWGGMYQPFVSLLGGLMIVSSVFGFLPKIIDPIFSFVAPIMGKLFGREVLITIRHMIPQTKNNTLIILSLSGSIILAITVINLFDQVMIETEKIIHSEYVSDIVVKSSLDFMTELNEDFSEEILEIDGVSVAIPVSHAFGANLSSDKYNDEYFKNSINYITDIQALDKEGFINVDSENNNYEDIVILNETLADQLKVKTNEKITYHWQETIKTEEISGDLIVKSISKVLPSINPDSVAMMVDFSNPILNQDTLLERILVQIEDGKKEEVINGLQALRDRYPEIIWSDLDAALQEFRTQLFQRYALLVGVICAVILIGLLNLVITLQSTIQIQRREYAILRAISMTPKQLIKVILTQSIMYSLISILVGTVTGMITSFAVLRGLGVTIMPLGIIKHLSILSMTILILSVLVSLPLAINLSKRQVTTELTETAS